jgi:hypothetical protein
MALFLWFINFWDVIADKIGEIGRTNLAGSLIIFIDADSVANQMTFKRDPDYLLIKYIEKGHQLVIFMMIVHYHDLLVRETIQANRTIRL